MIVLILYESHFLHWNGTNPVNMPTWFWYLPKASEYGVTLLSARCVCSCVPVHLPAQVTPAFCPFPRSQNSPQDGAKPTMQVVWHTDTAQMFAGTTGSESKLQIGPEIRLLRSVISYDISGTKAVTLQRNDTKQNLSEAEGLSWTFSKLFSPIQ